MSFGLAAESAHERAKGFVPDGVWEQLQIDCLGEEVVAGMIEMKVVRGKRCTWLNMIIFYHFLSLDQGKIVVGADDLKLMIGSLNKKISLRMLFLVRIV